jgi:hypothetical protein
VLEVLAEEVARAIEAGAPGLPLRDAGDLLRARFAGWGLDQLGFRSFTELVDLLLDHASLVLVRLPGGGSIIGRPTATSGRGLPAAPPEVSARTEPPPPPSGPAGEGGASLTLVSVPEVEPRPTVSPATNPIYEAFGVAGPVGRRPR